MNISQENIISWAKKYIVFKHNRLTFNYGFENSLDVINNADFKIDIYERF